MGAEFPAERSSAAALPELADMSSSNFRLMEPTVSLLNPPLDMTIVNGNDSHGLCKEKNVGALAQSGM